MPTYEYLCPEGHRFELIQKITGKPRAKCPVCGKPATRQISGGAGLVFKGSGFYITDYGKDGKGPRKEPETASPVTEKASSEKPAADKPAAEPAKPDTPATPSKAHKPSAKKARE